MNVTSLSPRFIVGWGSFGILIGQELAKASPAKVYSSDCGSRYM